MANETVEKKKDEDWMQKKWRPAMGWMYMLICTLDMGIFPILWAVVQTLNHQPLVQWNPLTLQGAGLFHIAMGAVLGISAFGRTQEKLAGTAANPTATTQTVTNNQNMSGNVAGGYGSGQGGMQGSGGFGSAGGSPGFSNSPSLGGFSSAPAASSFSSAPAPSGFGGAAPIQTTASGKKIVPTDPDPVL
jgi:hypothetical protein